MGSHNGDDSWKQGAVITNPLIWPTSLLHNSSWPYYDFWYQTAQLFLATAPSFFPKLLRNTWGYSPLWPYIQYIHIYSIYIVPYVPFYVRNRKQDPTLQTTEKCSTVHLVSITKGHVWACQLHFRVHDILIYKEQFCLIYYSWIYSFNFVQYWQIVPLKIFLHVIDFFYYY